MPDRRTHKHLPGKVGRNCLGDKRSHWLSLDLCEHLQKFRTLLNKLLLWAWALVVVDFLQQWLQQFCLLSQVVLLPCIAIRATLQQTAVNMWLNNNMSWDNSYSVSDRNSSISWCQLATLIFHLINGLLCTMALHKVWQAGVLILTCGSCHLKRSARPHLCRG